MLQKNNNKIGRTFWDLLGENPKKSYALGGLIVLSIGGLILKGISMQVGNFKVNPNKEIIHDTIVQSNPEKQYLEKPITITRSIPTDNKPIKAIENKRNPLITVKKGDTIITTNQPSNINTGNNNGVIGNGNAINVNVSDVQRKLTPEIKLEFLNMIKYSFEKKNVKSNCCLSVSCLSGNNESFKYGNEIIKFLKDEKYNVIDVIGYYDRMPPVIGVEVGFENPKFSIDSCFKIHVGYKP